MAKARIAAILVVLACCLVGAATAFATFTATQWAGQAEKYHLNSGQSGFLNHNVILDETWGKGENRAVCSGVRNLGQTCVGRGETAFFGTKGIEVEAEPSLHNHDAEAGYFKGYYFGEP